MSKKYFIYLPVQMLVTNQTQNVFGSAQSGDDNDPGFRPRIMSIDPDQISAIGVGLPEPMAEIEDAEREITRIYMKNGYIFTCLLTDDELHDVLEQDVSERVPSHVEAAVHYGAELFQNPHIFREAVNGSE